MSATRPRAAACSRVAVAAVAAVVATGALTGCASYTPPALSTAQVVMTDESDAGYVLDFRLDAKNANAEPLPLREVRYTLRLDGREVFRGVRGAEGTIPRYGARRIDLPAAVAVAPGAAPPTGVVRYELEGTLMYVTPGRLGQIFFDTGVSRPTVAFRQRGELEVAEGRNATDPQSIK
ncbi:MAG: LEA type 2 family protein [Phycisphaerales bacterium]